MENVQCGCGTVVARTSVFDRQTFPLLRSTGGWRVTTYAGKPSGGVHNQSNSAFGVDK